MSKEEKFKQTPERIAELQKEVLEKVKKSFKDLASSKKAEGLINVTLTYLNAYKEVFNEELPKGITTQKNDNEKKNTERYELLNNLLYCDEFNDYINDVDIKYIKEDEEIIADNDEKKDLYIEQHCYKFKNSIIKLIEDNKYGQKEGKIRYGVIELASIFVGYLGWNHFVLELEGQYDQKQFIENLKQKTDERFKLKTKLQSFNKKNDALFDLFKSIEKLERMGLKTYLTAEDIYNILLQLSDDSNNLQRSIEENKQLDKANHDKLYNIIKQYNLNLKNKEEEFKKEALKNAQEAKKEFSTYNYFKGNLFYIIICVILLFFTGYLIYLNQKNQTKYKNNESKYSSKIDGLNNRLDSISKSSLKNKYDRYINFLRIKKGKLFGINSAEDNLIIPPIYNYINYMKIDRNVSIRKGDKTYTYGDIDNKESEIISVKYSDIKSAGDIFFKVKNEKYFGLINSKNDTILPLEYNHIFRIRNGLLRVTKEKKTGFFSLTKKQFVVPLQPNLLLVNDSSSKDYIGGAIIIKRNNKYGLLNEQGELISSIIYDDINQFFDNYIIIGEKEDKYDVFDYDGNILKANYFDRIITIDFNRDSIARFKKNEKWGLINNKLQEILANNYNRIGPFYNGLAYVELNKKWGVIDRFGIEVISMQYDSIERLPFYNDESATVFLDGRKFKINKENECIENCPD
ncbi:hypothetical protein EZY14_007445 [Kordia sp. TARA_039_SRF]|nr:hypothetical protein EZY14_007445 [Kordia sp. TARA_039_SRF]